MIKFKKQKKGSVTMLDFFDTLNKLQEKTKNKFIQTDKKPSKEIKEIYETIINALNGFIVESEKIRTNNPFAYKKRTEEQKFEDMQKNIWIAGGSLSELFIRGYEEKPKDVDIFIDYSMLDFEQSNKSTEVLLKILNKEFGVFEMKKKNEWEGQHYDKTFKLESIIAGTLKDFPDIQIELIFLNEYELKFDLSFREFYYNGDFIVATERALKDIKEKKITFNSVESPLSTLIRAKEFAKRYNYTIDKHSEEWITKYLKYYYDRGKKLSVEEIRSDFNKIEKYKNNFNLEQLIINLESAILTKEDEQIVGKISYETYEMNIGFFRNTIERIKIIEEEKIDTNKVYELSIPKLSSNVEKYIDSVTQKEVSKEITEQINKKINYFEKTLEIQKLFIKEDEEEEVMIQRNKYKIGNEIQTKFNVKAFKNDEIEHFYEIMKETIKEGKLKEKKPFFKHHTEDNFDYFGPLETIENCILSSKIYLKPTLEEYLFKNNNENSGNEIEFKYSESEKELTKKFNYDIKTKNIFVSGESFGYLINERREFLLTIFEKGIETHPYGRSKIITQLPINKTTNEILFRKNYLSKESNQILKDEYQLFKEEQNQRDLVWRQAAIKRMNTASPPNANNGKIQVLPDITEDDLPF
jgi:hypothetical protein